MGEFLSSRSSRSSDPFNTILPSTTPSRITGRVFDRNLPLVLFSEPSEYLIDPLTKNCLTVSLFIIHPR